MARNRGCCRRAKSALTRDCSPVRLPNWVEGYLQKTDSLSPKVHSQAFQMLISLSLAPGALCQRRGRNSLRDQQGDCLQMTFC